MRSQIINDITIHVSRDAYSQALPQLVRQRPDFEQKLNLLRSQQLLVWSNQLLRSNLSCTLLHILLASRRPDFEHFCAAWPNPLERQNSLDFSDSSTPLLQNSLEQRNLLVLSLLPKISRRINSLNLPSSRSQIINSILAPMRLAYTFILMFSQLLNKLELLKTLFSKQPTRVNLPISAASGELLNSPLTENARARCNFNKLYDSQLSKLLGAFHSKLLRNESNCFPAGKVSCGVGSSVASFRGTFSRIKLTLVLASKLMVASFRAKFFPVKLTIILTFKSIHKAYKEISRLKHHFRHGVWGDLATMIDLLTLI